MMLKKFLKNKLQNLWKGTCGLDRHSTSRHYLFAIGQRVELKTLSPQITQELWHHFWVRIGLKNNDIIWFLTHQERWECQIHLNWFSKIIRNALLIFFKLLNLLRKVNVHSSTNTANHSKPTCIDKLHILPSAAFWHIWSKLEVLAFLKKYKTFVISGQPWIRVIKEKWEFQVK